MAITNYPEYPAEQIEWLRQYYPTHSMKDTHKAFNEHFGLELSESSLKHRVHKFGIKTVHDGKFKKGNIAWNKDMDLAKERPDIYQQYTSGTRYRFQKGSKPKNTLPIGSETKYKDFVIIKVSDDKWMARGRHVYEQTHNCKLTSKEKILHLDGDKYNDDPNNLVKVTDSIIARLVKQKMIFKDRELTRCAVTQQTLLQKIKELEEGKE